VIRARSALSLAATVLIGGIGCSPHTIGGIREPLRGPITVLSATQVCVGGPAASGDCFVATASQLEGLREGQCVLAHWKSGGDTAAADDLVSIAPVSGTPPDC